MTIDDLVKSGNDAVRAAGREDGFSDRIIVRAVVMALRDELYSIAAKDYDNWWLDTWVQDRFDEILLNKTSERQEAQHDH